jgi:hypothetical protein
MFGSDRIGQRTEAGELSEGNRGRQNKGKDRGRNENRDRGRNKYEGGGEDKGIPSSLLEYVKK